jgi:hypothetical protein
MNKISNQNKPCFYALPRAWVFMFIGFFSFLSIANGQVCGTISNIEQLRRTNREAYQEHLRIEKLTAEYQKKMANSANARLIDENGTITIPVVFHVLHRGESVGTGTNISDAQIIEQMAILNQCFSQTNDQSAVNPFYKLVVGNPNLRFEIACTDQYGQSTNGIIRKQSSNVSFSFSSIKSSSQGGDDAWPTDRFLNIWINPSSVGNILGYGTVPNLLSTTPNEDGVIVRFDAFGVNTNNIPGNNGGRTLVHEIGHWLNLDHLFHSVCSDDDGCFDTPTQGQATPNDLDCSLIPYPNPYLPNLPQSCGNPRGVMYDNFMDYTNDNCGRRMFSKQQVNRMRAVFQVGGPRRGFIDNYFKLLKGPQSANCTSILYGLRTAFCGANGNINWSVTGPATISTYSGFTYSLTSLNIPAGASGQGVIKASWNNFIEEIPYTVGYGVETSSYDPIYYNTRSMTKGSVNMTSYNNWTYGRVSFTHATGPAKNWRIVSSSSQAYISGSGNNFGVYLTQPYALVKVQAEIPTLSCDLTIEYSFLGGYLNPGYGIAPNPASNSITISATGLAEDPNARTTNQTAYEVHIFNRFNQLLKKTTCPRGSNDVQIDVSSFPSNQLYTVKLISANDVQTKSFFKQ